MLARAGAAQGKDVVAGATDADAELHGGHGPLLADDVGDGFQLGGGGEGELRRVGAGVELGRCQGGQGCHWRASDGRTGCVCDGWCVWCRIHRWAVGVQEG